jgi:hypothetical protein
MATTTPNFGWAVPTSTDLVKDGAVAIETLGDAIDASLVDLKGGTTGQVLAKASGTDMDFTWTTDASGISPTIFAAKGDLLGASANDTPAVLTVGANGETLVADSSTSTGLRYQTGYNGNAVINGAFDIWQRGTSFVPASYNYGADRFSMNRGATGSTVSRQASGLTGFNYAARVQRDSGNSSTSGIEIMTTLETADCLRFAGQTMTISFYARAGANFSAASSNLAVRLMTGTGTDQPLQSFSGFAIALNSTATLTTSWARYSYTLTLGSSVTEFGFNLLFTPVGTAGAGDYFDVTGVQIELGSVATNFKRASGGTIQGELAACQRYYFRTVADNAYTQFGNGSAKISTQAQVMVPFPVVMRVAPTALTYGSLVLFDGSGIVGSLTVTLNYNGRSLGAVDCATTGLTQFRPYFLLSDNTTSGFIAFSAEL